MTFIFEYSKNYSTKNWINKGSQTLISIFSKLEAMHIWYLFVAWQNMMLTKLIDNFQESLIHYDFAGYINYISEVY